MPKILNARDAIVHITSTAICGCDLHLYDGYVPTMKRGDVLGHELMGEVVEVGPGVGNLAVGDPVVVPFPIACGNRTSCVRGTYSLCESSHPDAGVAEKLMGHAPAGVVGCSPMLGGYPGGQAQYARVPFADVGPIEAVTNRALTIEAGQCHVQRYLRPLLDRIRRGGIDPSFVITHRMRLDDAPRGYETFKNEQDECVEVVLTP